MKETANWRPQSIQLISSSRSFRASCALRLARACHSIAMSSHACLKSRFGTSRASFSHSKALPRYFSEISMIIVPLEAGAQHSLSPATTKENRRWINHPLVVRFKQGRLVELGH